MTGLPKGRATLLAAGTGVALGFTFSPLGGPVLPFLAFAPLTVALDRCRQPGMAFRLGLVAALVGHGIGLYWMIPALQWRTALAVPIVVLLLALIGITAGLACQSAEALDRRGLALPVALAVCWVGFDWTAAHVPGISYAWLPTGASLAWVPALAAGSEALGSRFLALWTVACGAALALAGTRRWSGRRASMWLALLGVPAVLGPLRQSQVATSEVVARVAAIQPGRGASLEPAALSRWAARVESLETTVDLVVLPERFIPSPLVQADGATPTLWGQRVRDFAESIGRPVVVGAPELTVTGGDSLWYNGALGQPPDGGARYRARKARLVPALERQSPWLAALLGLPPSGYAPGEGDAPMGLIDPPPGVLVCYDSAFGETARALLRRGAGWLLVISDDDWMDPSGPFMETWAYWQHATLARLRAIETRSSVVQVATTGYTFAVGPDGVGPDAALPPGREGVAVLPVRSSLGPTLFSRTGDGLGLSCFLILVWGLVPPRRPTPRTSGVEAG